MATKASIEGAPFEPEKLPVVSAADGDAATWKGDMLALGIFEDSLDAKEEDVKISSEELSKLDTALQGIITEVLEAGDFKGKQGNSATVRLGAGARYITLVGMGKEADGAKPRWGASAFQLAGGAIAKACATAKCKTAAFAVAGPPSGTLDAQDLAFGVLSSTSDSMRFKSKATPSPLASVSILGAPAAVSESIKRGQAFAAGNLYAKYLVEAPPNVCSPAYLAASAQAIADKFPDVMKCTILEREDCEKMGMGCYLGVAMGSDIPPKFIHLTYTPKSGEFTKKLALVGKGVTFDTGGYNLKAGPGSMINVMKFDMGGSAAVFGSARALAELQPSGVQVHFISAACENMINGVALRPGDVMVSAAGKTVEIGNTDAEGRLTLCDALWYAQEKVGAEKCLDIATLTGAQIVALGMGMGAVMAPEDTSVDAVRAAGRLGGEKWWQLPLEDSYFELLKSPCADMNNIGGRWGGSITAGLFLKQFVDAEKMDWAHLDMAGPVWDDKTGATGFGATTLANWVEGHAKGL